MSAPTILPAHLPDLPDLPATLAAARDSRLQHWWSLPTQRLAQRALTDASQRAQATQRPIIASATIALPWRDPLTCFSAAQHQQTATYWEQPRAAHAFVAVGSIATLQAHDAAPIATLAHTWRATLLDAVHLHDAALDPFAAWRSRTGPLCFGGFAFDPQQSHQTARWADFPNGLLTIPRLLLSYIGPHCALTLNTLVAPNADLAALTHTLALDTLRFAATVEATPTTSTTLTPPSTVTLTEPLPADEWMRAVAASAAAIRRDAYHKIVLARAVEAHATAPFASVPALDRLRRAYPTANIFAFQRGASVFIGATPELLARVSAGRVETMALAGTAPRGSTPAADAALGQTLLDSAKNAGEHAIVVAMLRDALTPLTTTLTAPASPHLLRLANVQHLETPISGDLRPRATLLDVAAALHPTPAVGGFPRAAALAAIRASERLDRGWYTGPLGWLDANGEGEFAVALRSALLTGAHATLYAGCGIVADSDPAAEYAESQLKLRPMLHGLGIEAAPQ